MKFTSKVTLQVLLMGAFLFGFALESFAQTIITTDAVKFRSATNKRKIIGGIPAGETLTVTGTDGPWTLVQRANGETGRIFTQYTKAVTSSVETVVGTGVSTDAINFRKSPNNGPKYSRGIPAGANFDILAESGSDANDNWLRVRYQQNGQEKIGYVYNQYVDTSAVEKVAPTPMPSQKLIVDTSAPVVKKTWAPSPFGSPTPAQLEQIDQAPLEGMVLHDTPTDLRVDPSSNAQSIKTLPGDKTFEILGRQGGWLLVKQNGQVGWIDDMKVDYSEKLKIPELKANDIARIKLAASEIVPPTSVASAPAKDESAAEVLENTFGQPDPVQQAGGNGYMDITVTSVPVLNVNPDDPNLQDNEKLYGTIKKAANVRDAATGLPIEVLPEETRLEVTKLQENWVKVAYTDIAGVQKEGWVHESLIDFDLTEMTEASDGTKCVKCDLAASQKEDLTAIFKKVYGEPGENIDAVQRQCLMDYYAGWQSEVAEHTSKYLTYQDPKKANYGKPIPDDATGNCAQGVRRGLNKAGLWNGGGLGHAKSMHNSLKDLGFVNLMETVGNRKGIQYTPETAPPYTILVYGARTKSSCSKSGGGTYGHVELKISDNLFSSDYESDKSIQASKGAACRPLIGVMRLDKVDPDIVSKEVRQKCNID